MKTILIVGGILLLGGAITGYLIYNKPYEKMESASIDFKTTAESLFTDFESDENLANEKYLDKIMVVSGVVKGVNTSEDGLVNVMLESGGMMGGVICKLDELTEHKRKTFSEGETVTFKGICTGMLMDVVLVRCVEQ